MKRQPPFDPAFLDPVDGIYNADPDAPYVNGDPRIGRSGSIPPMEAVDHAQREIVNAIEASGQTPDHTNLEQLQQSIARHSSGAVFGVDTGAANAYVVGGTDEFEVPTSLFAGMRVGFYPANANTGASTLNAWGLGAKAIVDASAAALSGAELQSGRYVEFVYDAAADGGNGAYRLTPWSYTGGAGDTYISALSLNGNTLQSTFNDSSPGPSVDLSSLAGGGGGSDTFIDTLTLNGTTLETEYNDETPGPSVDLSGLVGGGGLQVSDITGGGVGSIRMTKVTDTNGSVPGTAGTAYTVSSGSIQAGGGTGTSSVPLVNGASYVSLGTFSVVSGERAILLIRTA